MFVGLIDVDGHNFPNLPLMKISAWHKRQGDTVAWYDHRIWNWLMPYDKVYMSKVFSFSPDYPHKVHAKEIVKGGSGYCIELENGREVYHAERDIQLPYGVEHIYPDYDLYGVTDTAYGFLSRGCPRGCDFCHVKDKEGRRSVKVANLDEFWRGQPNICLSDPNIMACKDWKDLLGQLAESRAKVDFNQGIDVRLCTDEKIAELNKLALSRTIHMAWDRPEENLVPYFENFKKYFRRSTGTVMVYVLVNFMSSFEEDLYRIYELRRLGYEPYIMTYDKEHADKEYAKLARWVNNKFIWRKVERYEDYKR